MISLLASAALSIWFLLKLREYFPFSICRKRSRSAASWKFHLSRAPWQSKPTSVPPACFARAIICDISSSAGSSFSASLVTLSTRTPARSETASWTFIQPARTPPRDSYEDSAATDICSREESEASSITGKNGHKPCSISNTSLPLPFSRQQKKICSFARVAATYSTRLSSSSRTGASVLWPFTPYFNLKKLASVTQFTLRPATPVDQSWTISVAVAPECLIS